MKFQAPPPGMILEVLAAKAQNNSELLAQLEAAQWQAIAMLQQRAAEGELEADEDEDEDVDDPV